MSVKYSSPENKSSKNQAPFQPRKMTRDEIVREYDAQNSERARNARLKAQESAQNFRARKEVEKQRASRIAAFDAIRKEKEEVSAKKRELDREHDAAEARLEAGRKTQKALDEATYRTPEVLSSKEYQAKTRKSFEQYERERQARDPYSSKRVSNNNRIVIDARGTIDSRAFDEKQIISRKAIDDRDKHDPFISTTLSTNRWKTKKQQQEVISQGNGKTKSSLNFSDEDNKGGFSSLPQFVKVAIPIIVILIIILIFIFVRG